MRYLLKSAALLSFACSAMSCLHGGNPSSKLAEIDRIRQAIKANPADRQVFQSLLALCTDRDPVVAANTVLTIGLLARSGVGVPAELQTCVVRGLDSPHPLVTRNAALAAGEFGERGAFAVDGLLRCITSSGDAAVFAANALGEIRAFPDRVLPELVKVACRSRTDGTPTAEASAAIRAIGRFGPSAKVVEGDLRQLLDRPESPLDFRGDIALALARIGFKSPEIDATVSKLYSSHVVMFRYRAIQIIREIPEQQRTAQIDEIIEQAASDPIAGIRQAAAGLRTRGVR